MRGKSPTSASPAAPPTRFHAAREGERAKAPIVADCGDQETATAGDGLTYHISDRWAQCYPGKEVAVITNLEKPPVPPEGFVPLRLGVHHQCESNATDEDEELEGYSVDTLLWNEELLESRLDDLMAWTRREPLSLRERLDRINWLINHV